MDGPFMTDPKGTQPGVAPELGVKMSPKHKGPCQREGCLQVDTVWRSPSDFRRHWCSHDSSYREHVCGDCDMWFSQKSQLTTHVNTKHLKVKNFACKCGLENVDAAVLYRHFDAHPGDTSHHDWARYGKKTRPDSLHSARDLSKGAAGIRHAHFDARRAAKAATRQQQEQQQLTPPITPAQPVEQRDLPAFVPPSQVATDPNAGWAIDPALGYIDWAHEPITPESEFDAMAGHRLGEFNAAYDAAHLAQTDRNLADLLQHQQDVREQLATAPSVSGPAWDNLVPDQPVAPEQHFALGQPIGPEEFAGNLPLPADYASTPEFAALLDDCFPQPSLDQPSADEHLPMFDNIDPSMLEAGEFGADAYPEFLTNSQ